MFLIEHWLVRKFNPETDVKRTGAENNERVSAVSNLVNSRLSMNTRYPETMDSPPDTLLFSTIEWDAQARSQAADVLALIAQIDAAQSAVVVVLKHAHCLSEPAAYSLCQYLLTQNPDYISLVFTASEISQISPLLRRYGKCF